MHIVLFDLCALPVYVIILMTCHIRKIIIDRAGKVFMMMTAVSLVCCVLDMSMELVGNPLPISTGRVYLGYAVSYGYFFLRNGTSVLAMIYIFYVTKTEYRIKSLKNKLILWAPNAVVVFLLLQNPFTRNVFSFTVEEGYQRRPLLMIIYAIAALYFLMGFTYTLLCKKYLPMSKWLSVLSIYILTVVAVVVQLINPDYLVEMFSTAISLLLVMHLVMRPEDSLDTDVRLLSWRAYQEHLKNILFSGQHVQIVVMRMSNAEDIRTYLGEDEYNNYVMAVAQEINKLNAAGHVRMDMYFEKPGTFYMILEDVHIKVVDLIPLFLESVTQETFHYSDLGLRFMPLFCIIKCPMDLDDFQDIINLGHRFFVMNPSDKKPFIASEMMDTNRFMIMNRIEGILNRAINGETLEVHYQPIYDVQEGRYRSAEALARVRDTKYGMISPAVFIPAAESIGLILPLGDLILEKVFRFIAEHDLEKLGLQFIEINLSVAQCLQSDLPQTIEALQKKYKVKPSQVNFEVTETMFDDFSEVMDNNLNKLKELGYTLSLDDYGVGYSNIRRMCRLPLDIVKVDKSIVDEMFTEEGAIIIDNTISMMRGIHKKLVMEGVETQEEAQALAERSCNYIQGFYYSKPLPEKDFIRFLEMNQGVA